MHPLRILFFGTPQFAATILQFLLSHGVDVVAAVTKPDRPQKRSQQLIAPEVKQFLMAHAPHIPILQPEIASTDSFIEKLASYQADLFIVAAYGEIIKQKVLDLPKLACINVHGSILPKYRGAAPIQRSLMEGEKKSGVTIMHMVRKMDAGDMLKTATLPIPEEMTYGELDAALAAIAGPPLLEIIQEYAEGRIPPHTAQNLQQVTFAPKIELADCQIDWRRPAKALHNLVRGVNPDPGAWCMLSVQGEKKRLKVWKSCYDMEQLHEAGVIVKSDKNTLAVGCGIGSLSLLEVQLEGKRRMTIQEFLRGNSVDTLHFEAVERPYDPLLFSSSKVSRYEAMLMAQLRCRNTDTKTVREVTEKIGALLVAKVMEELPMRTIEVETPVATTHGIALATQVELLSILRSGDTLLETFAKHFPDANLSKLLIQRNEETAKAEFKYMKLSPTIASGSYVIITEPMIATGGTLELAISLLKEKGVLEEKILIAALCAAPEGLTHLWQNFPQIKVVTMAIDERLNHKKYIVPGLGDFGDRYFGTPA